MIPFAALLLVAIELGGGFGEASARIIAETDEIIQIDLQVEVKSPADSVVAHLALPGEPTLILPMLLRDTGLYGITTELKQADYQVVFEILGPTSIRSQPVSLTELGAGFDDEPRSSATTTDDPRVSGGLWLAVAFGAASLSALAFWVLGASDDPDETSSDSEAARK